MSRYYDKNSLKERLEIEQIYDLIELWGGEPEYTNNGLTSQTICHNNPGDGSRKLYYYDNTKLFVCFSGCLEHSFDIFELCIKIMKIQKNLVWELYDAMNYIASYFGFDGIEKQEEDVQSLEDWKIFDKHKFKIIESQQIPILKEYNPIILERFSYPRIENWEREGILNSVNKKNLIGYYPNKEQITIPHWDINNRLIGIRGRFLAQDMADRYGKYLPLKIGKQIYNHPLSMNLYNLNNSKDNIKKVKTAIIVESEKSTLQYQSYYGYDNDISVACCGSSISTPQARLLNNLGVRDLIVAFDKDYIKIGDEVFQRSKNKLLHIYNKYKNMFNISFIWDKKNILPVHSSPLDCGPHVFEKLLGERLVLNE